MDAVKEEGKGSGGRGMFSMASKVWEAVVGLLVSIIEHVKIDDEMFDDVLEVLGRLLEREYVRRSLEAVNGDAVWLAMQIRGMNPKLEIPVMEGRQFSSLDITMSI